MPADVVDLREFYMSPLGLAARDILRARIARLWPNLRGERVAALGYGLPLLRPLKEQGAELLALMPAEQGVSYWPDEGPNIACFADLANLPLLDDAMDRIIIMHALEASSEPQMFLAEAWRVMKSGGRILLIVPNRRGFWAHSDTTPFGTGEPYSRAQIKRALNDQGFLVHRVEHALFMPPTTSRLILPFSANIEHYGSRLFPGFGGLLMIEAGKQVYAPLLTKKQSRQRRLVMPLPDISPAPIPT